MAIKDVWCAFGYAPRRDTLIGVYSTQIRAKKAADGKGEWGANGDIKCRQAYHSEHTGHYYLLDPAVPVPVDINNAKAQADERRKAELLSNMSEDDKRVLGFN